MKIKGCLTSNNQCWSTPKNIYQSFMDRGFFDPCPINSEFDGLKIEWSDKNFVNPPYNAIDEWIDKALREREKGKISIFLIPARTDAKWFRKLFEANCYFKTNSHQPLKLGLLPIPFFWHGIHRAIPIPFRVQHMSFLCDVSLTMLTHRCSPPRNSALLSFLLTSEYLMFASAQTVI